MELSRPTFIKVHRKHLSPETLDKYDSPRKWDEWDSFYIVIKNWIPEHDQKILFEHTRKIRERELRTDVAVELKRGRDKLLLIRKKSSSKTTWFGKKQPDESRSTSPDWTYKDVRWRQSDSAVLISGNLDRDKQLLEAEIKALEAEKRELKEEKELENLDHPKHKPIKEGEESTDEQDEIVDDELLALWTTLPPDAPDRERSNGQRSRMFA